MRHLSNANLRDLPQHITVPLYDRQTITPGIVHIGVGNFHRGHQAVFIDDALNRGETDWGITGISLRRTVMREALQTQDCLYTLKAPGQLRILGALKNIATDKSAALLALIKETTRIVTLTITEKAYNLEPDGAIALLHEALKQRRALGLAPFTLLSCDNLPSNGVLLKNLLITFAQEVKSGMVTFIENEVASPCSMVDRIVPQTTDALRTVVENELGLHDAWPVQAESFTQWVLQDHFPQGRPRFEESGVEFVSDVAPYEKMKLRLLNGAHTAIALIGTNLGYTTVAEAIADPDIKNFIELLWQESSATLPKQLELVSYTQKLTARFEDHFLQHQLAQISTDTSQKLPQRIIAPLNELLDQGKLPKALIFTLAVWFHTAQTVQINDPKLTDLITDINFDNLLHHQGIFGTSLPFNPIVIQNLRAAYDSITQNGCRIALKNVIQS